MKEITELLGQLATELGTTAGKLWGVLLRQAPISGALNIILCITLVVASVWVFRFVQDKTTAPPQSETNKYPSAAWGKEGAFFAWVYAMSFIGVAAIFILSSVGEIVTAFFNPEFWALKKILSTLE
jgi:hypothetical protein